MPSSNATVIDQRWTQRQLRDHLARVLSPAVCQRVIAALDRDGADFGAVADIIQGDPYVCTKVLAMANMAQTDEGPPITSIKRAVQVLGMQNVRLLMLSVLLTGPLLESDGRTPRRQDLWRWIIACSVAGQWIGSRAPADEDQTPTSSDHDRSAEYLVRGLVMGLGALILYAGLGRVYTRVLGLPIRPLELSKREAERVGVSHHQVTVWAVESMGSPAGLGECAAALAAGDDCRAGHVGRSIELLGARVAGYESDRAMIELLAQLDRLGVDSGQLFGDQLRELRRRAREMAKVFGVNTEDEQPQKPDRRSLMRSAGSGMQALIEQDVARGTGA